MIWSLSLSLHKLLHIVAWILDALRLKCLEQTQRPDGFVRAKPEYTCNLVGLGAAVSFFSVFLIYLEDNSALIEKPSLVHCFKTCQSMPENLVLHRQSPWQSRIIYSTTK